MDYRTKSYTAIHMLDQLSKLGGNFTGSANDLRSIIDNINLLIIEYTSIPNTKDELSKIDSIALELEEIYALTLDKYLDQISKNNMNKVISLFYELEVEITKLQGKIKNRIMLDSIGNIYVSENNKQVKIVQDKVSGGYLLSIFNDPSNQANSQDEWFDSYEELEYYFKKHNLQVEWLDNDKDK